MQKPHRFEVDGLAFVVNKLPPSRSIPLSYKVMRGLFPALGIALGKLGEKVDFTTLLELDVKELFVPLVGTLGTEAIPRLLTDVKPEDLQEWMDALFEPCLFVQGADLKPVRKNFDLIFTDHEPAAYRLLLECIEVNFGRFFGASGLAGLRARAAKAIAEASQENSETSGPSGASSLSALQPSAK